jgi:hypothetical protein
MKEKHNQKNKQSECTRCHEIFRRPQDKIGHAVICGGKDDKTNTYYELCRLCPDIISGSHEDENHNVVKRRLWHESNDEKKKSKK